MREVNFVVYKDEDGMCMVAKVINFECFNTPMGVATEIKKSRQYRKTNVCFVGKENAFSKSELKETEKFLK